MPVAALVTKRRTCRGGSRMASRLVTAGEAPACGECTARMMADSIAGGMTGSTPLALGTDRPTDASRIKPPAQGRDARLCLDVSRQGEIKLYSKTAR